VLSISTAARPTLTTTAAEIIMPGQPTTSSTASRVDNHYPPQAPQQQRAVRLTPVSMRRGRSRSHRRQQKGSAWNSDRASPPTTCPGLSVACSVLVRMACFCGNQSPGSGHGMDTDRYMSRQDLFVAGFGHVPGVIRRWTLLQRSR
jgi:hypothetical protein